MKPLDREERDRDRRPRPRHVRAAAETPAPPELARGRRASRSRCASCRDIIARAAKTTATVLLRGESGTGKEVAARAIHEASARERPVRARPLRGASPTTLLESELFGYERGAFTGAAKRSRAASSSPTAARSSSTRSATCSPPVQVKLLRVLAGRRSPARRRHDAPSAPTCASSRRRTATSSDGRRAGDVPRRPLLPPRRHPDRMPPLRERREDIPELAERFCAAPPREERPKVASCPNGVLDRLARATVARQRARAPERSSSGSSSSRMDRPSRRCRRPPRAFARAAPHVRACSAPSSSDSLKSERQPGAPPEGHRSPRGREGQQVRRRPPPRRRPPHRLQHDQGARHRGRVT